MGVEQDLEDRLRDNYRRLGRETGYWAKYFARDLRRIGGLATAKKMLRPLKKKDAHSGGLQKLIDAGRVDLSLETTVLQKQFRKLFTEKELTEAKRRLDSLPDYLERVDISPEENFPDEVDDDAEFVEGKEESDGECVRKESSRTCGMSFKAWVPVFRLRYEFRETLRWDRPRIYPRASKKAFSMSTREICFEADRRFVASLSELPCNASYKGPTAWN